jgi:hypothetical protein
MGKLICCANDEMSKRVIHRVCEIYFFHYYIGHPQPRLTL